MSVSASTLSSILYLHFSFTFFFRASILPVFNVARDCVIVRVLVSLFSSFAVHFFPFIFPFFLSSPPSLRSVLVLFFLLLYFLLLFYLFSPGPSVHLYVVVLRPYFLVLVFLFLLFLLLLLVSFCSSVRRSLPVLRRHVLVLVLAFLLLLFLLLFSLFTVRPPVLSWSRVIVSLFSPVLLLFCLFFFHTSFLSIPSS